jgi:hypothetical protein
MTTELVDRISTLFRQADAHSGVAFDKPRSDAIAAAINELVEAVVDEKLRRMISSMRLSAS